MEQGSLQNKYDSAEYAYLNRRSRKQSGDIGAGVLLVGILVGLILGAKEGNPVAICILAGIVMLGIVLGLTWAKNYYSSPDKHGQ